MTPQQQSVMIEQTIQGVPGCNIAHALDVHPSTISRAKQHPAAQEQIAKIKAQLLDQAAQQSADNIIYAVQGYKAGIKDQDGKTDTQLRDHGYKASVLILQSSGLLPHTQGPTLIQINNNVELSPALERIMMLADTVGQAPAEAMEIIDI